jgi:hypothetical protein
MIENDSREWAYGIELGQKVNFRWNRRYYDGVVQRLTRSKVSIRFVLNGEETARLVDYRQIVESKRFSDRIIRRP